MKTAKLFNLILVRQFISFIFLLIFIFSITQFIGVLTVQAGNNWWETVKNGGLGEIGNVYQGGDTPKDIRMTIIDMINIALGVLGILFMIIIIIGGFKIMMSGGNEENITSAKKMIAIGTIGLAIILLSYVIANFIIENLIIAIAT